MKKSKALLPLVYGMSLLQGGQTVNAAEVTAMRIEPVTAIRHSDGTADGLYQMGRVYQSEKRLDQAAEAYRSALAKDPEHIEARNALATVYAAQGKFDESVTEFQAVLHKSPDLPHVYNNLGYTHFLNKDYTAAISDFGQAIARDPANTRAFANLALVHEQLGNSAKAQAALHLASAFDRQLSVAAPVLAAASTPSASSQTDEVKTAEVKTAEVKTAEAKTDELKTAEAKTDELKTAEAKTAEAKTAEAKTAEAKTAEAKTAEAKTAEAKTDELKTAEAKTDEAKTAEAKTDELKTAEAKTDELKTAEAKADELKTAEAKTDELKTAEAKTDELKTAEAKTDELKSTVQQAAATASSQGTTAGITIEIANGTRDKALADGIATRLRDNGYAVSKIAPLMPYTQHRTVILYRDGFRNQALELSRSFAVPPAIVNNTHTRRASDTSNVRLVLGKASAKAVVIARLDDKVATR